MFALKCLPLPLAIPGAPTIMGHFSSLIALSYLITTISANLKDLVPVDIWGVGRKLDCGVQESG